jgi:hypothetical protein
VGPKTVAPKKTKQGLAGIGLVDEDEVGAVDVDSGVSAINSKVGAIATIHTDHHARLVHVDPAINSDKYYILQLLEADGEFYCFRRSGKTGTSGIGQLEGPFALSEAKKKFEDLFTKKCGQKWAKRDPDWVPANSKV